MHIFHSWGKWEDTEEGDLVVGFNERVTGRYIVQERKCTTCGLKDIITRKFPNY